MRRTLAAAAALLLASCYDPGGQCSADTDCLSDQVCGPDALCIPGTRPPPGDPPVAAADAYTFTGSGPFQVSAPGVLANDAVTGGATLTAELVSGTAHGTVYLAADGSFTYVPVLPPGGPYAGPDSFTYRATTGALASGVTTVSLTIQ